MHHMLSEVHSTGYNHASALHPTGPLHLVLPFVRNTLILRVTAWLLSARGG